LFEQQSVVFHQTLQVIRKTELKNYIQLARSSVAHIYNNPTLAEEEKQQQAKQILTNLAYENDGYFYAYSTDGTNLVHPKQPYRVGKNWLNLTDSEGKQIIQALINEAQEGGGYTEYLWEQPSSGEISKKLGYSEMLEDWNWMFGTGIYMDDIEKQVNEINTVFDQQIRATSFIIILISAAAVAAVFAFGQFFQLNERRQTDNKLQLLNKRVVSSQDDERRRVSRELHDGISQRLVAIKYALEETYSQAATTPLNTQQAIKECETHIDDTITEIRRISHDLHPSVLDDLGLMAAVQGLSEQFEKRTGILVNLKKMPFRNLLPTDAKTALYRIVQEALTNIEKHANAPTVSIQFELEAGWFKLAIVDNGCGYNTTLSDQGEAGLGLRNMSERIGYFNGVFDISSSSKGTCVSAGIPQSTLSIKNQTKI
jgi:two-component system NarL family sensor kinase